MKKTAALAISVAIASIIGFVFPLSVLSWDDCPSGQENDEYPGDCPRYVDTDEDGICDNSQPAPEDREDALITERESEEGLAYPDDGTEVLELHASDYSVEISGLELKYMSVGQIAYLWGIDADEFLTTLTETFSLEESYTTESIINDMQIEANFRASDVKDVAEAIKTGNFDLITWLSDQSGEESDSASTPYNFPIPFLMSAILYIVSWYVSGTTAAKKIKYLSKPIFKMFWNTILVISAIPSVAFGFYLVLRYSIPALRTVDFDFLWWHVEGSIVFGTISVLHLVTRLRQYVAPLRILRKSS